MDYPEYVECLVGLLSDDPEKIAEANIKLFHAVVNGNDAEIRPGFALADAEQRLTQRPTV